MDQGTLPSGKRVADASTRELAEAAKKARGRKARKSASLAEAAAQTGARASQAALRKKGAKGATAEAVRRAGGWWIRVEVPASAAAMFM